MKCNIYIIGMPGTGKTHFGRTLSQSLKMGFHDLDDMIEKLEEANIRQVIQSKGEKYFREKEREVLISTTVLNNVVIACGGGTPIHFDNLDIMKSSGIVVWLNTDLKLISRRIAQNITRRPMFLGLESEDLDKKLNELFGKRRKTYAKADITIDSNSNSSAMLSAVIQRIIKKRKAFLKGL